MTNMLRSTVVLAAVLLSLAAPAGAQETRDDSWEFLTARLAAEEGHYDDAIQRMDKLIARSPANEVLLYERAMMLIDAGKLARAENELRSIVEKNPGFYDAARVLGRMLLDRAGSDRKRLDDALSYLQLAFRANPDDLSTGIAISQILTSTGRLAEAETILATMVERMPDVRGLNYTYAQVLTKLGRGDESTKYLERAVTLDATFVPAIMQLLDIYQKKNEWAKAAEILEPLIADDPLNLEMQRQQAFFYLRAGDARRARDRFRALTQADPRDARSLFYLAEALNDLDEYGESEPIFRKLLLATPNDPDLLTSFGLSLAGQKKWDEASQVFNAVIVLPNVPDNLQALARTQLAFIDLQKGNNEAAYATASSIGVFRDKINTQAINIAVEALKRQKKPSDAATYLGGLLEKFPADPFLTARYVEALTRAGDLEKAGSIASAHAKLGTRNTLTMAEALVAGGSYDPAIEIVNRALTEKTDDVDLLFELAALHERKGDRERAAEVFLRLLAKHPDHAPSLNYLGYMWAEEGVHLDRAEEMLTRAVGQEPENGAYVDSLGWVYYRLGKLEAAEKYLTDATRLTPRDATVHEHLGDVLAKRGDMERALKQYRTALSLDPEAKDVDKLRSKIAELERKDKQQ
jgi:predicted Zn-dependent protease